MYASPENPVKRNPNWTRDELLVALDYYFSHPGDSHDPGKVSVQELTRKIGQVAKALGITGSDTLRNANGVSMKLLNFRNHDPNYQSKGRVGLPRGNRLEGQIWHEYESRKTELKQVAQSILDATEQVVPLPQYADDYEAAEGRILIRVHLARERNAKLVARKKAEVLQKAGRLACEICGFDFAEAYGERGNGFIECHHTIPLSSLGTGGKTRLTDLALLCANCHRMIHVARPWWTVEEARGAYRHS